MAGIDKLAASKAMYSTKEPLEQRNDLRELLCGCAWTQKWQFDCQRAETPLCLFVVRNLRSYSYSLLLTPYSLLLTPYSLLLTPYSYSLSYSLVFSYSVTLSLSLTLSLSQVTHTQCTAEVTVARETRTYGAAFFSFVTSPTTIPEGSAERVK